jgi:hypothetical protein
MHLEDVYQELGVRYHMKKHAARNTLNYDDSNAVAAAFNGQPRQANTLWNAHRQATAYYAAARNARRDGDTENRRRLLNLLQQGLWQAHAFRESLQNLAMLMTTIEAGDRYLANTGAGHIPRQNPAMGLEARTWAMTLPETGRQLALGRPLMDVFVDLFDEDEREIPRAPQTAPALAPAFDLERSESDSDSDSDDSMDSLEEMVWRQAGN